MIKEANQSFNRIFRCFKIYNSYEGSSFTNNRYKVFEKDISLLISELERRDKSIVGLTYNNGESIQEFIEMYSVSHYNKYKRTIVSFDFNMSIREFKDVNEIINHLQKILSMNAIMQSVIVIENFDEMLNPQLMGSYGVAMLKGMFSVSNAKIILTGLQSGFDKLSKDFPYLYNDLTMLRLSTMTKQDTLSVLNEDFELFKQSYKIGKCPNNICEFIVNAADKYVKDKSFPGKAYQLMHEVLSLIKFKKSDVDTELYYKYIDMLSELDDLKTKFLNENDDLVRETLAKNVDTLTRKAKRLEKKFFNNKDESTNFDSSDLIECASTVLGIENSILSDDKLTTLKSLESNIKKKVKGQDEAVSKLVDSIKRSKLGLNKKMKTIGNFFFIGPSGVGKTELAKTLTRELYGSEDKLIRLDMSEFSAEVDVSKLLGAAPGYIGFGTSGVLVNKLKQSPDGVILFDEVEKAHSKIMDTLLQLLDEGFITSSTGEKIYCNNYVIIFTSNIGVKESKNLIKQVGFNVDTSSITKREEEVIMKAFKDKFRPEFINRLDQICFFSDLDFDTMSKIFNNEFEECIAGAKDILPNCNIIVTDDAKKYIIEKAVAEKMGARPLYRLIQNEICSKLADKIINDGNTINDTLKIDIKESALYVN